MKAIIVALISIAIASCSSGGPVYKKLADCDSLVITFTARDGDAIRNSVSTTEKKAIRKLAGFLDGKNIGEQHCGFDGHLIFYKEGQQVMPVVFQYTEDSCRHFLFDLDNKITGTRMNKEATSLLKSLAEGKSWY